MAQQEQQYDLIVIGSGPGGYVAAIRASQLGFKTAVVEKENLGGICLNWGCIPTKALLKSAEVYDYLQHAKEYGLKVKDIGIDFDAVVKRSRTSAQTMNKGIQFLFKKNKIDTLWGHGKVIEPGKVEVKPEEGEAKQYSAKHVIIATGARARQLPGLETDDKRIIEYRQAMVMEYLPKKMVVMGSGAIGSEFAHFYNTMGTEVTLVEYMDRILPAADEEVSRSMHKLFKKRKMAIHTGSKVTGVEKTDKGVKVTVETPKGNQEFEADVLLSAVGIQANTEGLGIEELGLEKANDKIKVGDFYETNIPGVYAIGDCTPGPALAHKASAEGILCVEKLAGQEVEPMDYNNCPSCVYTNPEVAWVGYNEQEAREAGYEIKVGNFPFSASGKATAAGKKDGFVKVIFDAKYGEFLGAHMIGNNVTEMIAEVVSARRLETTGHEIIKSVHPHPTMSEAVMEAAADAYGEVIHL